MSELTELIDTLRQQQVKIWAEGDKLRYRALKGQVTDELLAALKSQKAELLTYLNDSDACLKLAPIRDQEHYALSAAQQRLWLLAQMDEDSVAYTIPLHLALNGTLNKIALEQAIKYLIQRHESLRTSFINIDGEPRQKIGAMVDFKLETVELSVDSASAESRAHDYLLQQSLRAFDLQRPPLLNAGLLKFAEQRHLLGIVMHHIISDGWSIGVIMRELWQAYRAFCHNQTVALAPLAIQYRDFAAWQNRQLASDAISVHRQYWLKQLTGEIPVLKLPTDYSRPPVQTFNGHELSFSLDALDSAQLQTFCQQRRVSLFMLLQAAVTVLCYRYTEQTDIIIGSPIAGRNAVELEDQIGFYINTLVLRHRLQPDQPFSAFLQQVRQTTTEAYDHQIYPFDRLVNELHLQRDLSRSPLFDVMVILQNASGDLALNVDDLAIEPVIPSVQTSKLDLTWHFHEQRQHLNFSIEYNCDLFTEVRIERMGQHFNALLQSLFADPDQTLDRLNILTDTERGQLLQDFNTTDENFPCSQTLADLFATQVEATPDAVAVTFADASLSYRQLDQRSCELAIALQALGVKSGDRIGICLQRSQDLPVALLAVLKAGAAYVPLDPAYPQERLVFMLEDAGLKYVLTQQHVWAQIAFATARPIFLDGEHSVGRTNDKISICNKPPVMIKPNDIAYIIYTSGSTGQPKGVQITHRSLVNFLTAMQRLLNINAQDILLAVTTLSFDIAGLELYGPLICGAQVVIASREQAVDGRALAKAITAHGISIMQATPATWHLLLAAGWQGSQQLKIFCGGEALPRQLAAQLQTKAREVWNLYGPTETTIWSSAYRLTPVEKQQDIVPIGRPIANTQIYILNCVLQPVPIGVTGELYIGGEGLSPGYWRRPELTMEKFIRNPFQDHGLIYRTGDLARFAEDGAIEYLGRIDNQVKLRGFRIELGEIETAMLRHPVVAMAVAVLHSDGGDKRLLAYLTLEPGLTVTDSELREHLGGKLPGYMLPESYIMLNAFPLTPNGKIDRNALPRPDQHRLELDNRYLAPRNALEAKIAAVWRNVLDIETVGVFDNFFELGGHSLKATKLIVALQREHGLLFKLADIFQNPSIAQLTSLAETRMPTDYVEITPMSEEEWALLADD